MFSLMGSTAVAYLAITGLATNLALAGRGVVRTLRRAARGELADAGKEVLDALSAPTVLTQAASAGLVLEVLLLPIRPVLLFFFFTKNGS
jgi:hypothetical protein